ncbi:hypothetical protein MYAM1_002079 [Malassezia yamatoensis]|uniref:Uncharacterized protein n=1 Tax=Malassezia yamatoensis TaxID=253288 RepID=A0AAJ5YTY1_9BASI|nr:hypothetical protein MYAM1_002079 [Malassezia yamatoensis]
MPNHGRMKRQAHAERQKMLQMLHALSTRLQYAVFKMDNGWTRHSLSEIENLYYRRRTSAPQKYPNTLRAANFGNENASLAGLASHLPRDAHSDASTYGDFWSRLSATRSVPATTHDRIHAKQEPKGENTAQSQAGPLADASYSHASPAHASSWTLAHDTSSSLDMHDESQSSSARKRPRVDHPEHRSNP